ncbi:MAG: Rpn family recombination-promoting nuclease/putative transposase [Defluviitaleaceae bacterium]|nr:Rpn family recombination-promoting nuclease/putative transposase [Defluviitaleaceae bacterium]MCL2273664.1 Rpn family recombination-promoting nuclease/putative transposase [Defluviitaleaceae bacterium]
MDKRVFLPIKSDVIFRLFYADERNEEFLINFLKSILRLPDDDYDRIDIADPHLLREFDGDKLAIIDVKLYTKTRKVIHIEIQLQVMPEQLQKRVILYDAKLIAEQVGSGDDYDNIKKVISIIITDENLIPGNERYHHRFTLYDPEAGVEFSDILEINTLELRKLPEIDDGTDLYDWAKFIAAETEEELAMVAEKNPVVSKAVVKLRELSADERARDLFERREKARRDQAARVKWELKQQQTEIAKKAISMNISIDDIVKLTGLTSKEVEELNGIK